MVWPARPAELLGVGGLVAQLGELVPDERVVDQVEVGHFGEDEEGEEMRGSVGWALPALSR